MRWFSTRSTKEKTTRSKETDVFVKALNEEVFCTAPYKVNIYKFYESHPEYKSKVDDLYYSRHGRPEGEKFKVSEHAAIAKELFLKEDRETQAKVKREQEEKHAKDLEEYEAMKNLDMFDTSVPALVERYVS
jgi:hypothetical protein